MYQIFASRRTSGARYFLELIERHGARTFGTSNIPALYEAKERELAEIRDSAGTDPCLTRRPPATSRERE